MRCKLIKPDKLIRFTCNSWKSENYRMKLESGFQAILISINGLLKTHNKRCHHVLKGSSTGWTSKTWNVDSSTSIHGSREDQMLTAKIMQLGLDKLQPGWRLRKKQKTQLLPLLLLPKQLLITNQPPKSLLLKRFLAKLKTSSQKT